MMPRPVPVTTRTRQSGQSLISMMVGLVISLITIAAMLTLYKTMVGVSNEASVAARRDGQVAAGLLAAQMELQSAGFGVDPATVPLVSRLSISAGGKQVAWHYRDGAGNVCTGLWVDANGIYRLRPRAGCADAATAVWAENQREPLALMPTKPDGSLIQFAADEEGGASLAGYSFKQEAAACLPYRQQDYASTPAPAAQRIRLANADDSKQLFSICLPNLG
ncbi:MAG: hypothetical protein WA956_15470 [Stenotrophomonas sp.]